MSRRCRSGKVLYGSEGQAWDAAAHCIRKGVLPDMQVYLCPFCRHFHLSTAKMQLHDWWWRPMTWRWRPGVANWFKMRGTIDQWDNE